VPAVTACSANRNPRRGRARFGLSALGDQRDPRIIEGVALDVAHNAYQARSAAQELVRGLVRYLLVVALATHVQAGEGQDTARRTGGSVRRDDAAISPDGERIAAIDIAGAVADVCDATSGALLAELRRWNT